MTGEIRRENFADDASFYQFQQNWLEMQRSENWHYGAQGRDYDIVRRMRKRSYDREYHRAHRTNVNDNRRQRWHNDPVYRAKTYTATRQYIRERYRNDPEWRAWYREYCNNWRRYKRESDPTWQKKHATREARRREREQLQSNRAQILSSTYGIREAARKAGVSHQLVYYWIAQGRLEADRFYYPGTGHKIVSSVRVRREAFDQLLEQRQRKGH